MNYTPKFGRKIPPDFDHIAKYSFRSLGISTVISVEKALVVPNSVNIDDNQGSLSACVGAANSILMTILNNPARYPFSWLWYEAKVNDGSGSPDDDRGTTIRAAFEALVNFGHVRILDDDTNSLPSLFDGIELFSWATNINEMRTAISLNSPISLGCNWPESFNTPIQHTDGTWWIGESGLSNIVGSHNICVVGAFDSSQSFLLQNSWGPDYPQVHIPYDIVTQLLSDDGEAGLVTDRLGSSLITETAIGLSVKVKPVSGLRLRAKSTTSSTTLLAIPYNTVLIVLETSKDEYCMTWYQVTYNGKTGWVAGWLCKII